MQSVKRKHIIVVILFLAGITVFAQSADMSLYIEDISRTDTTVFDILATVEDVRNQNLTGFGDFYNAALRILLYRLPNFTGPRERLAIHDAARIILRGLAAEKYTAAAANIWRVAQEFDVVHEYNDGTLLSEALVTLGQIDAKYYVPHIILRLENFNADQTNDLQTRRKIQIAMKGAVEALETLKDPAAIKPIFYASIGWYDPDIRGFAAAALPKIMDDPATIITEIIQSPFNNADVKFTAWKEMLKTNAPNESKAKVAAATLETSYSYVSHRVDEQNVLRFMRISAIDAMRRMGAPDDSVYSYIARAYRDAFNTPNVDTEVVNLVISTLSAIRTEKAVDLLTEFLSELNVKRRSGPWGNTERDIMQFILPAIANTGTQSRQTMLLLSSIQRSDAYTGAEQGWAGSALRALVK